MNRSVASLLACAFAASPLPLAPAAAAPPGVNLGHVDGESQEDKHKDAIAAQPVSCATAATQPVKLSSDPEEGGQVTAAARSTRKPTVNDITVMKASDAASAKLAAAPPPATPPARGCASAQR